MIQFLTVLIAIVCLLLMAAVLIQNPKGGGLDSTFGGGGATQLFGAARSNDIMEKITWGLAIAMAVLCVVTGLMYSGGGSSIPEPTLGGFLF